MLVKLLVNRWHMWPQYQQGRWNLRSDIMSRNQYITLRWFGCHVMVVTTIIYTVFLLFFHYVKPYLSRFTRCTHYCILQIIHHNLYKKWKKKNEDTHRLTVHLRITLTLSGPLLSNTMFTMAHWLVLKLLYISSLTTFKIPLCFVHSVTLLRRFMRAILKSNKPTEGGQGGQLFNLFYQIWLDLSFVVWQRLYMVTNKGRQ